MSKGLEALENIGFGPLCQNEDGSYWRIRDEYKEDFNIIEKELKELEERREMMKRFNEACVPMILDNETEKKLKALEIILKKKVNVYDEIYQTNDYKDYKENFGYTQAQFDLTEEEYNLLKEVLKDE